MGTIRTHESTRKLARRLAQGTARVLSATVRHERGRWFVSFPGQVKREPRRVARPGVALGIGLGVQHPLVMDRDQNAARNLAALAATVTTGTAVAADQDTHRVSKPRGADHKTRTTRPSRNAGSGRAGGATSAQCGKETRDRRQAETLTLR